MFEPKDCHNNYYTEYNVMILECIAITIFYKVIFELRPVISIIFKLS